MKIPPTPSNESARLAALDQYEILDTAPEPAFDDLTRLAAHIMGVPIALVSLVDRDRQWFKSRYGLAATSTSRDISFCGHVVALDQPLVIPDTRRDVRFADNPLVLGAPLIRFYAGIPLRTSDDLVLGTLCTIDRVPRAVTDAQLEMLQLLANQVVEQLESHRRTIALARSNATGTTLRTFYELTVDLFATIDLDLRITTCNPAWASLLGWTPDELFASPLTEFVHPDDVERTRQEAGRLLRETTPTVNFEHRFRHRDGTWAHLSWVAVVKEGRFFASARDVSTIRAHQAETAAALAATSDERSRLHSILTSASHAIIETTSDGRFREFNAAAERMLGYSASEVIGRRPPVHVPSEIVARAEALSVELGVHVPPTFEALIAKARLGIPDRNEWTYVRKDGTRLPVELVITARRDRDGQIVGYMGIASDITQRKLTEHALEQRTRLLRLSADIGEAFTAGSNLPEMLDACVRAVVTNLDAAFARIWILGEDLRTLELQASAGLYTHLDGPHAQIPIGALKIGQIALERHPHLTNAVIGDPRVGDQEWVRREGITSFAGYPLLVGDRLVGVMAMFARHSLSDAEFHALGTIADSVAVGLERKRVESQLDQFKATLDRTQDSIFISDARSLRFTYANEGAAKQLGYTTAELLEMTPTDLNPHFDEASYRKLVEPALRGEVPMIAFETIYRTKDGREIALEAVLQYVAGDGGRPRFVSVMRDIQERRRVELLQSEFISTVSHELRTPLTAIRGALGLVAGGVTGALPAEASEYVKIALSNSDRLVRLINDILDIEKMQSGRMEFQLRGVEVSSMVTQAIAANRPAALAHHVQLRLVSDLPAGEVIVDPDRIAQVLANLISNAVKFSPRDSAVELLVTRRDDDVRIAIRDHGPGVSDAFRERIFQRFAQADSSTTRERGGTGLGLSISKAIVEHLGGQIGYLPAEGGGSVFFVDLPLLGSLDRSITFGRAHRILVCEDDRDHYRLLARQLADAGFTVDIAPTVERARRLLSARRYAAITIDLMLADGDGTTLIHEVRADDATRHVPIVVVSGATHPFDQAAVVVTDVLEKPFDEVRLLAVLKHAITEPQASSRLRLLHVEDDEDIRQIVKKTFPDEWEVIGVGDLRSARQQLASSSFDIVLLDLSLPDGNGEDLLDLVGTANVVIFSAMDARADLARRVTAALVKTRASSVDLRELIISRIESSRVARSSR